MRYCVIDLPNPPERAGRLRRIPATFIGTVPQAVDSVSRWLGMMGLDALDIEEWDMIGRDNRVLCRTGVIHADRRIVWRKS